ncbi:hypothetical protein Bca4012_045567 [Brassica carinata]
MGDQANQDDLIAVMSLMQQQMQQLQQTIQAQEQAAQQQQEQQAHTASNGQRNLPCNIPTTRSAIVPPPCTRQDFEIKPALIGLVQRKVFFGLSTEIPMEHIESFEKVCSFTSANGVPPDYIKCMLFPFSLNGKATRWLNSLPTSSLTSWEQVRSTFLNHFYSKTKTTALKNKITSFIQLTDEPFCDAWERFDDYRRECPHHGFDDDYLLEIFYDGVNWEFQSAMNSASNRDFMTQTTDGAFELIENMAATSANKNEESDRSKKGNSFDTQKIDELSAKVDQLLKITKGTSSAWSKLRLGRFRTTTSDNRRAIGKLFQLSGIVNQMMLQGMQIHGKALNHVFIDINTRMDNMFTELNTKYDIVNNHIKRIDVQLAQTAESVKRQQGMLSGKNAMNPRVEHCNETELRCEKPEGKEPKQLSAETASGAEERT